jgi:tetratricopeptide (TPR) repeat protein
VTNDLDARPFSGALIPVDDDAGYIALIPSTGGDMTTDKSRRPLTALAILAAIVGTSSSSLSQTSSSSGPVATSDAQSKPARVNIPPKVDPTPEQVGDALMAHQRYQAAIEAYKKEPKPNASVLNKLGIAYQLMLNLPDAIRSYQASLKLEPRNPSVLNNLGTTYDAAKQYRTAEKLYRKALKIDPQSALIHKNLGTNLLAQHKYEKGWESYKAALAIDPTIFDHNTRPRVENPASVTERGAMNYYMAKGCVRAGKPERAIQYLRAAINEGFTNPKKVNEDIEFASLHGIPEFDALVAPQKDQQ